jgi:hypothetical protein
MAVDRTIDKICPSATTASTLVSANSGTLLVGSWRTEGIASSSCPSCSLGGRRRSSVNNDDRDSAIVVVQDLSAEDSIDHRRQSLLPNPLSRIDSRNASDHVIFSLIEYLASTSVFLLLQSSCVCFVCFPSDFAGHLFPVARADESIALPIIQHD